MRLLAATSIVAMMPMSALAHTSDEQDHWYDDWYRQVSAEGSLTPALLYDYFDFRDRHQTVYLAPQFRSVPDRVERWRSLVSAWFPAEAVDTMMCLMKYESGGDPRAKNPTSSARGVFQIMASIWSPVFGVSYDDLNDPDTNIRLAAQIYDRQGYGAWEPYGRGLCHGL